MAYIVPTAAELKARYPAFAGVSDDIVNSALTEAQRMVDETWTEGDYATAIMLYACHIMALDGHGTSPDAQANTGQAANFQTIRSGQLTLTRGQKSGGGSDTENWYKSTRFGSRFWMLLQQNKGGGRVAASGVSPYHPGAFDWPWPGSWYP